MSKVDFVALKTELQTDPKAFGYATPMAAGDDIATAALVNQVRATISIFRSSVQTWEIFACLVKTDWDALAAGDKQLFAALLALPFVNAQDARIQTLLGALFPAGSATRTNLVAMVKRNGSRAEELFGEGTVVSAPNVATALRG